MRSSSLLAAGSLMAVLVPTTVRAEEFALNFDLPAIAADHRSSPVASIPQSEPGPSPQLEANAPLPVPDRAATPPLRHHSPPQLPPGVYRQAVAVALTPEVTPTSLLPPAPPAPTQITTNPSGPVAAVAATMAKTPSAPPPTSLALSFELASPTLAPKTLIEVAITAPNPNSTDWIGDLFNGNNNSLVARAIGSAEGTRTTTGDRTAAYYGHIDPGNGVWNLGTFSYQHGAASPTEADARQLRRLKTQTQILQARATQLGLSLSLEETLNGIDLANQSPLAAIGRVGYVERLAEARALGHSGMDAIVVARTRSYINPNTQRWNAPGLGNSQASITRDQRRRARAVSHALLAYQQENASFTTTTALLDKSLSVSEASSAPLEAVESSPVPQSFILGFDLEPRNLPSTASLASEDRFPEPSQAVKPSGLKPESETDRPVVAISGANGSDPNPAPSQSAEPNWNQTRESKQNLIPLVTITARKNSTPSGLAAQPSNNQRSHLAWLVDEPGAMPQTIVHPPTEKPVVSLLPASDSEVASNITEENSPTPTAVDQSIPQIP
ncbi:MAG: hypothetical protein ACKO5P_11795 [Nodosilinea sp.]